MRFLGSEFYFSAALLPKNRTRAFLCPSGLCEAQRRKQGGTKRGKKKAATQKGQLLLYHNFIKQTYLSKITLFT